MKFFIDTAEVKDIIELNKLGIVDGVTTNPSLILKSGKNMVEVIKEISNLVDGPISAEVVSAQSDGMIAEGLELLKISKNIAVKIPLTWEGLKACQVLSENGAMVNITLCFSVNQALLAARAGATYVSPFLGRLDDIGHNGLDLVSTIAQIFDIHGIETEIIAASIRHPQHVTDAAMRGAHIATVPLNVIMQLFKHPLTDQGIEKFLADWNNR